MIPGFLLVADRACGRGGVRLDTQEDVAVSICKWNMDRSSRPDIGFVGYPLQPIVKKKEMSCKRVAGGSAHPGMTSSRRTSVSSEIPHVHHKCSHGSRGFHPVNLFHMYSMYTD